VKLLFDLMNAKASCKLSQNCSEVPKYLASRAAISGVVSPLFPNNVVDGGRRNTKFYPNRQAEMPIGSRNSSRRISPG
jgi:hypothetical protein